MAMRIVLALASDVPLYQQIYEQVRGEIIKGELPSGFCLPPIRTVARELRISVITIKKAWEELERGGYIHSMTGRGCFVAPLPAQELINKRDRLVQDKLVKDIAYYQSMGITRDELIDLVDQIYQGTAD